MGKGVVGRPFAFGWGGALLGSVGADVAIGALVESPRVGDRSENVAPVVLLVMGGMVSVAGMSVKSFLEKQSFFFGRVKCHSVCVHVCVRACVCVRMCVCACACVCVWVRT